VAGPRKLGVPVDLRGDLYNSWSSTELCCDGSLCCMILYSTEDTYAYYNT